MLMVALVLAVIGLAALVTAVVTSNELIAWVCIGASVIGVLLLVFDAVRERASSRDSGDSEAGEDTDAAVRTADASTRSADAQDHPDQPDRRAEDHSLSDEEPDASAHDSSDDGGAGKPGSAEVAKPE